VHRTQVGELYYIAPVANVPSILATGILSARASGKVTHVSIASSLILSRRANKPVSATRKLPDYVNLYFCARNKMMSRLLYDGVPRDSLCVLQVSERALDMPEAVIADGNASSDYTRFDPVPVGLPALDHDVIHAEWWTKYEDERDKWEHGRRKNAELLIPDVVPSKYIRGALAPMRSVAAALAPMMGALPVVVAPYVFFSGPKT
jgi:hypothetical protein